MADSPTATNRWNPRGFTQPTSYHHIVEHTPSGVVYLAGQVGADATGVAIGTTVSEQFGVILRNFDLILTELGLARDAFLKVQIFTTDISGFNDGGMGQFAEYFSPHPPATTMVAVSALAHADYLIEVDATLARPS